MSQSVDPLAQDLRQKLEETGALQGLRADVRAALAQALLSSNPERPPSLNSENLLINELLREYLIFNNYLHTDATLVAESGQPRDRLTREVLVTELHMQDTHETRQLPLLYVIIELLRTLRIAENTEEDES